MTRRIFCRVLLVIVAVFALLAFSSQVCAQGRSEEALEHAKQVQERHTAELMILPDVVGTAVALDQGDRAVVKVFTVRGGVPGIPGMLEGVPVQPVVTGEFYALPKGSKGGNSKGGGSTTDPTSRFPRPVPIGVSTGHPDITAGTIGCRVTDGDNVYVLSNNHVYANENAAKSMMLYGTSADPVLQPGPYDGGVLSDYIGSLYDYVPIYFDGRSNYVDAAIALSSTSLLGNSTPSGGYGIPETTTLDAKINQKVKKYGRTTGLTKGQVYALNATVNVGYDSGVARFVGQIIITPGSFSAGGDSGSLIVADDRKGKNVGPDDNKPVGLLFAGSSLYTIANPIDAVLGAFPGISISIDGK